MIDRLRDLFDRLKRFLSFWSTWVVLAFATLAEAANQGLVTMPAPLKAGLYAAFPWLAGWESYIWLAVFVWTFYRARMAPQGIDVPR